MTQEEIAEIKSWEGYKSTFAEALRIHREIHDPDARHFRNCHECKSGFALLLIAALKQEQTRNAPIAQRLVQSTHNRMVAGSSPAGGTIDYSTVDQGWNDTRERCAVCGNILQEHWRGRPCLEGCR